MGKLNRAKDLRARRSFTLVDAGRSNQALQAFNRMNGRDLAQALEIALKERIENESLKKSIRDFHLSKKGEMPMRAIHAILMKQPDDFEYYDSLRTPIMQKLSRDPAMMEEYLQYAQNATPGWEDTAFKRVIKTAPNDEDIYGFIGVVSYRGTRKVTPHVVFDKDQDKAFEKAMQNFETQARQNQLP